MLHHARNDGALHALKYGSARNTAAGEGTASKKSNRDMTNRYINLNYTICIYTIEEPAALKIQAAGSLTIVFP